MADLKTTSLTLPATRDDLAKLEIGTAVRLTGRIFTAREGVYKRAVSDEVPLPASPQELGTANFHCSPAATLEADGTPKLGAVTATASFRFAKWLEGWFAISKCNIIIGKGGMSSADYKRAFVPAGAIYLTTVGYGTGALLGRGVKRVVATHWTEELGLAQGIWVLDCEDLGPFIVASDLEGNCLFERENEKIADRISALYDGTRPATLKRYGETDDKTDEVI
ncbi:MAG: fumarate hydratase C-terminal domain-containing protein [Pseudomonadota bacterium]